MLGIFYEEFTILRIIDERLTHSLVSSLFLWLISTWIVTVDSVIPTLGLLSVKTREQYVVVDFKSYISYLFGQ